MKIFLLLGKIKIFFAYTFSIAEILNKPIEDLKICMKALNLDELLDIADRYDIKVNVNGDEVYSYFATRKVSIIDYHGHKYFALNNQRYFLAGVLDQGYYQDGGLTAPNDEAMINDITLAKTLGFNFIRKHIKIESNRWYYHCDRLGMLVMQDMVNVGVKYSKLLLATGTFFKYNFDDSTPKVMKKFGVGLTQSRNMFVENAKSSINRLINEPCIFGWTIFNEAWGQFNSKEVYKALRALDDTRLFDVNSGWVDQKVGDFKSNHIYFRKIKMSNDNRRILFLSEFGGYAYDATLGLAKKTFSYKRYLNKDSYQNGLRKLFKEDVMDTYSKAGLAGYVYTQLTDVEGEINGFVTFDRQILKVDPDLMYYLNNSFKFTD